MQVDSYLELFTTLYGWAFYDRIYDILVGTGLFYLPFAWIVVRNMIDSHDSATTRQGVGSSLKRMEIELGLAVIVVWLAVNPSVPLNSTSLAYTPPALTGQPAPTTQTVNVNSSTFGSTGFTNPPAVAYVPPIWAGVMSISAGFNSAVKSTFSTVDARGYAQLAQAAAITNPALRAETNDFFSECYIPARSVFLTAQPDTTAPPFDTLLTTYGRDDPDWVGSHVYLATYYLAFRSQHERPGFAYNPNRDTEYVGLTPSPTWGRPYCAQWWSDSTVGLKQKLVAAAGPLDTLLGSLYGGFNSTIRQDEVVKLVLTNTPPNISDSQYAASNHLSASGIGVPGAAATAGVLTLEFVNALVMPFVVTLQTLFMQFVLKALPIIQPVLLMGIYMLLPFVLVLGLFSVETVFVAALGIFTVKFWSALWELARWIDSNLITSLYPDAGSFLSWLRQPASSMATDLFTKRIILDLITSSLYLVLPALFSAVVAWGGFKGLAAIHALQKGAADDIANKGLGPMRKSIGI